MKKVLINASNLHSGGGVQVAISLISELSKNIADKNATYTLYVSSIVYTSLKKLKVDLSCFEKILEINLYGLSAKLYSNKHFFYNFNVCLTVFGPFYFNVKADVHICGFGQSWIIYPDNLANKLFSPYQRLVNYVKYRVQWYFFKKYADEFVVELDHVKQGLVYNKNIDSSKVHVINNCVSNVFKDSSKWKGIDFSMVPKGRTIIGFVGRPYKHKNLEIIKEVDKVLKAKYALDLSFLFTFTEEEMERLGFNSIENFYSIGAIELMQCPTFYNFIDALIFPSLIESFSATPIEAMAMKVRVFASDLPFVRDVCKDYIDYFDPSDAEDIAKTIFDNIRDKNLDFIERAYDYVDSLPDARSRAAKSKQLINLKLR